MLIAFQKNDGAFFARVIRTWTQSPYSHVELLLSDNQMFSSHMRDGGTRYVAFRPEYAGNWNFLEIPTTCAQEEKVRAFCDGELHCSYDWYGILVAQVLGLRRSHKDKWFCSEVCTAAIQVLGGLVGIRACTLSPGELYTTLVTLGAKPFDLSRQG